MKWEFNEWTHVLTTRTSFKCQLSINRLYWMHDIWHQVIESFEFKLIDFWSKLELKLELSDMSVWRNLRLLLWKNYILQIRHPIMTITELLMPCLFVVMLAIIRLKVEFTKTSNATIYEDFDTNFIPKLQPVFSLLPAFFMPRIIIYSPNTSAINDLMPNVIFETNHDFRRKGCPQFSVSFYQFVVQS